MSKTLTGRAVIHPKETVENCNRIDIAELKGRGDLEKLTGCMTYQNKGFLPTYDITYRSLKSGFEGKDSFRLTSTPCYFGGERYWFLCPGCGRRVRVLYLPPFRRLFRCRNCHDLTYEARQDHRKWTEPYNRILATHRKIQDLLNSSGSGIMGLSKRKLRQFYRLLRAQDLYSARLKL